MGELTILNARRRTERALGSKFDLRAFHDAVLELGSVPLPVVDQRIDRLIANDGKGPYRTSDKIMMQHGLKGLSRKKDKTGGLKTGFRDVGLWKRASGRVGGRIGAGHGWRASVQRPVRVNMPGIAIYLSGAWSSYTIIQGASLFGRGFAE